MTFRADSGEFLSPMRTAFAECRAYRPSHELVAHELRCERGNPGDGQ